MCVVALCATIPDLSSIAFFCYRMLSVLICSLCLKILKGQSFLILLGFPCMGLSPERPTATRNRTSDPQTQRTGPRRLDCTGARLAIIDNTYMIAFIIACMYLSIYLSINIRLSPCLYVSMYECVRACMRTCRHWG